MTSERRDPGVTVTGLPAAPSTPSRLCVFNCSAASAHCANPPSPQRRQPRVRVPGKSVGPAAGTCSLPAGSCCFWKVLCCPLAGEAWVEGGPQAPLSRKRTLGLRDPRTTEWWSALPASPDPGLPGSASWAQKQTGVLLTLLTRVLGRQMGGARTARWSRRLLWGHGDV